MVTPFMQSKHFKCPKCDTQGMIAKLESQPNFHLVGDQFRIEQRGSEQEIVCVACGADAVPNT